MSYQKEWITGQNKILQCFSINIFDEVTVKADNYAYDMINLVVDLGSALRLWPGLSAVSIFDSYH